MKLLFKISMLTFALAATTSFAGDHLLYIQSAKAALMAAPEFKADKLAVLTQGTPVSPLQVNSNWTQVTHAGQTGWIANMLLDTTLPLNKIQLQQSTPEKPAQKARKRSSIQATAAATRGLTSQFRQRSLDQQEANYEAVQQMESQHVEDAEVDEFHKALSD